MNFHKSGIFIINKPYKLTSNDVLRKIKSRYKFRKIGHAGTLDPLATGILPLLINDTTKYFNYFQTFMKSYIAEIRFGYSTSTFDLEGEILNETNKIPKDLDLIAKKLSSFLIYKQIRYLFRSVAYLLILNVKKSFINLIKLYANIKYFFDLKSSLKR